MKLFKILSHPYTLIISFLAIMISGEHWGGFYITYLLTALPYGGLHSLLALGGVVIFLAIHHWIRIDKYKSLGQGMNVLGLLLLLASIIYFFKKDTKHYNWGTFEQGFPMFTIVFTCFVGLCFLIGTFWHPPLSDKPNRNLLSKV